MNLTVKLARKSVLNKKLGPVVADSRTIKVHSTSLQLNHHRLQGEGFPPSPKGTLIRWEDESMKMDPQMVGIAAEFACASELPRRNIYAQPTFGRLKRTDLLARAIH